MDFCQFNLETEQKSVQSSNFKFVQRPEYINTFKARHKTELNNLMSCLTLWPSRILNDTELFRKPTTFQHLGGIYNTSKQSKATSCLVLPDKSNALLMRAYVVLAGQGMLVNIDLRGLVSEELLSRYSEKDIVTAYLYTVYCLTFFNQKNTFFVHIDDDTKLKAALDRVAKGTFELPCYEYIYLDLIDNLNVFNEPIWESTHSTGISNNKMVVYDKNVALPSSINLPEIDMSSYESKMYDLYAFMLHTQDIIGSDIETTGLDVFLDKIVSFGSAFGSKLGFYISRAHRIPKVKPLYIGEKGALRSTANTSSQLRQLGFSDPIKNGIRYLNTLGDSKNNISGEMLREIVSILKKKKNIFHNAKFDYNVILTETGISLPIYIDTMLAHYVGRPGYDDPSRDKRGLKIIAQKELNVPDWKADITKCQAEEKDLVAAYNARDCCYMMGIAMSLQPTLDKIPKLFFDVEMAFLPVLMHAEREGIGLDVTQLKDIEKSLLEKMDKIEKEFKTLYEENSQQTDKAFNINSTPILKDLFYNKMGIVPPKKCKNCGKKHSYDDTVCHNESCEQFGVEGSAPMAHATPAGDPSLDKFALGTLASMGIDAAKNLKEYRAASKLTSSYTNLDTKLHVLDGKLHPSYNQARTATGRLSSSNPNFQQLPKKAGKYIRSCIVPNPKHCLVAADYAGQEIRILAAYSGDEKLIQAYNPCYKCPNNPDKEWRCQLGKCSKEEHEANSRCNVLDIHSYITKQIHGDKIDVPISEIKDHPVYDVLRSVAKSVTFSLAYGGSAYGIADKNNIPLEEAQDILKKYFDTFPGVKQYILECQLFVDENGYIPDMVNRVRRFKYAGYTAQDKENAFYEDYYFSDGLRGLNKQFGRWVRKDRRAGTNHPIQAIAATMNKIGSINLRNKFMEEGIDAVIVQFIHDEVLISCKRDKEVIKRVVSLIQECMVDTLCLENYCMPNHPLGWTWPPYLDMEIDIKVGDSYGGLENVSSFLESLDTKEAVMLKAANASDVELDGDDEHDDLD